MRDEERSFHHEVLWRKLGRLMQIPNYSIEETQQHISDHFSKQIKPCTYNHQHIPNIPRLCRIVDGGFGWPVVEEW